MSSVFEGRNIKIGEKDISSRSYDEGEFLEQWTDIGFVLAKHFYSVSDVWDNKDIAMEIINSYYNETLEYLMSKSSSGENSNIEVNTSKKSK